VRATVGTLGVLALLVATALGAGARGGVEDDPDVIAARDRLDRATAEVERLRDELGGLEAQVEDLAGLAERRRRTADRLEGEVERLGARADEAFAEHERNRRSYLDAAIAAYVSGMPEVVHLRAVTMADAEDRTHSLALARTLGDAFSARAERYRRTGESLDADRRELAEDLADAERAPAATTGDLDAARSARDRAGAALTAAEASRQAAEDSLAAARRRAEARIAAAAERFRLGELSRAELLAMADRTIAVHDITVRAHDAYVRAARTVDAEQPSCRISWWALAAIGRIETRHGTHGGAVILANGDVAPRILGPPLTGGPFAVVRDTDGGRWDGDPEWDRAVGPMQFIPSTWRAWATDGNGDGRADPHNYHDAAHAAARYLCRGARGMPLDTEAGLRAAALSYNRSQAYADAVLAAARRYGGLGGPDRVLPAPR
jgi:membrane-bound lytic murein transglycosylase B